MQGFENFDIATWFDGVTFSRLPVREDVRHVAKRAVDSVRQLVGSVSVVVGVAVSGHAMANETDASAPSACFFLEHGRVVSELAGSWAVERDMPSGYMPALIRSMATWERIPEPATELELPAFL